jgi:NAD+ synthase
MDIVLCGMNGGKSAEEVAREVGLTTEQVERVFRDIRTKRTTTRPLHLGPVLVEAVPEITK